MKWNLLNASIGIDIYAHLRKQEKITSKNLANNAKMKQIVTLGGVGVPIFPVQVLVCLFRGLLGSPGQICISLWDPCGSHFGGLGDFGWKGIVSEFWRC